MTTIRKTDFIRFNGTRSECVAEIDVDTAAELPSVDGIDGITLHQGSTALIITEGRIAILGGDGNWYCGSEQVTETSEEDGEEEAE